MLHLLVLSFVLSTLLTIDQLAVNAFITKPHHAPKISHSICASQRVVASREANFRSASYGDTVTNLHSSNDPDNSDVTVSRRDMIYSALKIPLFTVAAYAYGRVLYNALSSPSIATLFNDSAPIYPSQHENRISKMIQIAFDAASKTSTKTFRVLEVGIGTEARLIRRGLYNDAIHQLSDKTNIRQLEMTGLDVQTPTKEVVVTDLNKMMQKVSDRNEMSVSFKSVQSSITEPLLQYPDGYFDSIVFCFTLCSVDDPALALRTMKRLLRPNGGTIAYLEHVAVDDGDTDHQLLSYEQQLFDPIQQILADHCHLHRATESTMGEVLADNHSSGTPLQYDTLYRERFYIDQMWPVSCQACCVIQSSV